VTNKTIEILIYLLGYLKDNSFDVESLSEFSENLIGSGYTENDIAEALGLLLEKYNVLPAHSSEIAEQDEKSVRILCDFERLKISPEVYGYLLKLRALTIINGAQMERIIDYCMFVDSRKITESDVNEFLAALLFENLMK